MKIDSPLHRAKKAIVQVLFDLSQKRESKKEEANEKRKVEQRRKDEIKLQRQRDEVEVPDTPEAVKLWVEVMGQQPTDSITEIRAKYYSSLFGSSYTMSFRYRTEGELEEIIGKTHWSELSRALDTEEEYAPSYHVQQKKIPEGHEFWPVQPGKDSLSGGYPTSRPFVMDCYCFYLDMDNKRVFLSTGMTHYALTREINGKIQRTEEEKQSMSKWTP